jgi:hypothetical protein
MDDLAVALERLHKSDEAAHVMRDKLQLIVAQPWFKTIQPVHIAPSESVYEQETNTLDAIARVTPITPEREAVYTSHANLGTFLIHGAFASAMNGDQKAKDQLREGLQEIETAISIKPAAHFGREDWQSVAVRHFLACLDNPRLVTRYDLVGNPLYGSINDDSYRLVRIAALNSTVDADLTSEERVSKRETIPVTGADPDWVTAVHPLRPQPSPFDEPVLGILGMWMLGGGPNPHFALALGTICEQVGQREIAWEAYERAVEMSDRFSPDPVIRTTLIAYCHKRQSAIASQERKSDPADWENAIRKRHQDELAFGQKWQQTCQEYEAKQIASGTSLDSPDFYNNFHDFPKLASSPGHVDEAELVQLNPPQASSCCGGP